MVSVARKNLLEDLPRFLVAQAGIMFAVSLVTIQTGIFNGFTRSTTQIIEHSQADIWVTSESIVHLELSLPIPASKVNEAQKVAGVAKAEPLTLRGAIWRNSLQEIVLVRIIGFNPNGQLFTPKNVTQGNVSALLQPYTVMVDGTNVDALNVQQIGEIEEIATLPAQVIGLTQGNRSIVSNPFVFTSLENANAYANSGQSATLSCKLQTGSSDIQCTNVYTPPDPNTAAAPKPLAASDLITHVLIQAQPGEDLQVLKQRIETALPNTRAFTQAELIRYNQQFWQQRTGIGFILGLSTVVGVIVGVVVVGQILYSSVSDHLKEFGTLKAMGASDWKIYSVIVEQSLWMAILGYVPSMILCYGVGIWTLATQGIMILITPVSAIAIFGVTVLMCIGSAAFAIQKVTRVDPAIVFKA